LLAICQRVREPFYNLPSCLSRVRVTSGPKALSELSPLLIRLRRALI
jgi:hypothetical protein